MVTTENILRVLSAFIGFVFIQSLFFKYPDPPETQHIFGTLDGWAATFGAAGIFARTGLFSQYVIGTAELIAALLLLSGVFLARFRGLQGLGGLIALAVISGAICFHLFTPLGVVVQGDSGLLFAMAVGVWLSALTIVIQRRNELATRIPAALGALM